MRYFITKKYSKIDLMVKQNDAILVLITGKAAVSLKVSYFVSFQIGKGRNFRMTLQCLKLFNEMMIMKLDSWAECCSIFEVNYIHSSNYYKRGDQNISST